MKYLVSKKKGLVRFLVALLVFVAAFVNAGTDAEAAYIYYDECNKYNVSDITQKLVDLGIIYQTSFSRSGYTNGDTTLDRDSYSFFGCQNMKSGNTVYDLVLNMNDSRVNLAFKDKNTSINEMNSWYATMYRAENGYSGSQFPIFYGIKKGSGDYMSWMGARCAIHVYGFYANGAYQIAYVVYQTACTAVGNNMNSNYFGQFNDGTNNYVGYPGWEGGTKFGGWSSNCPGHWRYSLDVNASVNGSKVNSGLPVYFDVYVNGSRVASSVDDWASGDINADSSVVINNIRPKPGYSYTGNSSYTIGMNGDKELVLPVVSIVNYTVVHRYPNINGGYTDQREVLQAPAGSRVTPAVKPVTGFTSPSTQTATVNVNGSTTITYYYTRTTHPVNVSLKNSSGLTYGNYGSFDFYINGALVANDVTSYSGTVPYGSTYQFTDIKAAVGHTFDGINGTFSSSSGTITGTTTMYLNYHLNKYTIHFDTVGGVDGPADVTLNYNQIYNITTTPTRTGFTFVGWNTKADGTGVVYPVTGNIKNVTAADNVTVTLYARWSEKVFTTVKIANSWHGGTFVKRTPGDDAWFNSMGSWQINDPIPMDEIEEIWLIRPDGTITQEK